MKEHAQGAATSLPQHLLRLHDLSAEELRAVLRRAVAIKGGADPGRLAGRSVGLLFFRGSLRTRTSFEAALHQLGAGAVHLTATSDFWELEDREGILMDGRAKEHVKDAAAVLSRYVDALAIRPDRGGQSWAVDRKDHQIESWARHASVPVINMESALWHPLQALADLMTMRETLGELRGRRLSVTWAHSTEPTSPSVTHSLIHAAAREGMEVAVAHPPGYELDAATLDDARAVADRSGGSLHTGLELGPSVEGAAIVYARSWISLEDYGNPTLAASRRSRHRGWRVDEKLMALGDAPRFMHPMPIRRNLEVTDAVLDGPASLVYDQAENRLHTQKALLLHLLGERAERDGS